MITACIVLCVLGTLSMMINDSSGTVLNVAENRNKTTLAGLMDVVGDAAKFIMYGVSGTALMTHYGWLGRAFILPILLSGFLTTKLTTKWAAKHIEDHTDSDQSAQIAALTARITQLEERLAQQ